jgi:Mg2+/Co2+ transporter CorC
VRPERNNWALFVALLAQTVIPQRSARQDLLSVIRAQHRRHLVDPDTRCADPLRLTLRVRDAG